MKVFSSGSDKQHAAMSAALRWAGDALKIAEHPASRNGKPGLATKNSARQWSTLMSSAAEAEVCAPPSMSCESSYTVCISRSASRLQRRRFYANSAS
jgi:hypothetical protein